jgi:hypothetical protein
MARKKLTKEQITLLLPVTHNQCAMHDIEPTCENYSLIQGDHFFGEFAHISAAEAGGERYDTTLDDDQRNDIKNIIVLCPNHHTIIDKKDNAYTVEKLLEIKDKHENTSSLPHLEISAKIVNEAETIANITITNVNNNNGDGTQQNNTTTTTAPLTNYTAARDVNVYSAPPSPSSTTPAQVATGFYQPDQTLSMEAEITWLGIPESTEPHGVGFEGEYLQFSLGSKHFIVLAQEVYEQVTVLGKDTNGKYSMDAKIIVHLFDRAKLILPDGLRDDSLLQELRALSHTKSLRVVIGTDNADIDLIPFDKLDASSAECLNPIKIVLRGKIS